MKLNHFLNACNVIIVLAAVGIVFGLLASVTARMSAAYAGSDQHFVDIILSACVLAVCSVPALIKGKV